jgi:hypothetical protein
MRIGLFTLAACMAVMAPTAVMAQEAFVPEPGAETGTLQQQLMPESTVRLTAPAPSAAVAVTESRPAQPAMMARGSGTGLMIAGAALFVAGLLIEGDAGTLLAVTGAAVGAYGLYLHFN